MPGLKRSTFREDPSLPFPQPVELTAHENGINLRFVNEDEDDGVVYEVFLSPHHILAICDMNEDWWDSHWAELHEEQG